MFPLRPLPALLGLCLLTACSLRMQPGERARPGTVPRTAPPPPGTAGGTRRPVPPPIYRLTNFDTLIVGAQVLHLYPASRSVYEQLPLQPWLSNEEPAEGEELDPEAEERRHLRQAGQAVKRNGHALHLRCSSGKTVRLVNNPAETDDNIFYQYVATLSGINSWLVAVHLYEGGYFLIIDRATGRQTVVWSPPSVAPDGKMFVCGSSDVLARYEPSGLQVWRMENGRPRLLWERQTEWGVSQARWLNNHTIVFEQDFFHNGDVDTRLKRLALVN
ncbi:hypothetical protein [Hymenobacter koreensis]|uniref:WD40 repeat domain-containing protein n=1 Tax=Hymenobacter koreensis TaxID=1084523 RepID=A0ABP8J0F4_9BACT